MLNKQKTKLVWCGFAGELPDKKKPSVKRFRCPECGKRFLINEEICSTDCCITYTISRHKKKIGCGPIGKSGVEPNSSVKKGYKKEFRGS